MNDVASFRNLPEREREFLLEVERIAAEFLREFFTFELFSYIRKQNPDFPNWVNRFERERVNAIATKYGPDLVIPEPQ